MNDTPIESLHNIKQVRPPENLKPNINFNAMVMELEKWMETHQDRSYREIIKSGWKLDAREENTWEIRQIVRSMIGTSSTPEEDRALKWHLILHLARNNEEQRFIADNMLKKIKQKRSILEGSVESVDEKINLLGDLPQFDKDSVIDEVNISRILEAWLGLFGNYLTEHDILITLDHRILDFLSELWNSKGIESPFPELSFIPPSEYFLDPENRSENGLKGSEDLPYTRLRTLILGLQKDPISGLDDLRELSEVYKMKSAPVPLSETMKISIKHLSSPQDMESLKEDLIISSLMNKTLISMESI